VNSVLIVIGTLISLIILFLAYRWWTTTRDVNLLNQRILEQIDPIAEAIQNGIEPDSSEIKRLAAEPLTRNELHDVLLFFQRLDLFPNEYHNAQSFAESDMVRWLCHPNELECEPDEIELMGIVTREQGKDKTKVEYFVYRFRMHEPHWAAKDGWLAGVAGPYQVHEPMPRAVATFSRFEAYDSKSLEEHVAFSHDKLLQGFSR
jgi:hypothetical protein